MQFYFDPKREHDMHALPDGEVFYSKELRGGDDDELLPPGWYWWACSPGCLPDSEAVGPFDSMDAALANAREE